jgi:phosphate transport system protein
MEEHPHLPHLQEELAALNERLLAMGGLAEDAVRLSIVGLAARDSAALTRVLTGDTQINQLHIDIDTRCFTLLALHHPLAADLRLVLAAVKINSELERVGDLAVNIAGAALRYIAAPPVKPLIDLPRMSELAQTMLRESLDAYVRRDVALAARVCERDDQLDELKTTVFRDTLVHMLADPTCIEAALQLVLISRHLERIGDHATNIAEDAIFMVSARDIRHQAPAAALEPGAPGR